MISCISVKFNAYIFNAFLWFVKHIDAFVYTCRQKWKFFNAKRFHYEIIAYASVAEILLQHNKIMLKDGVPDMMYLDIITNAMNSNISALNNVFILRKKQWSRDEVKVLMEAFDEIFSILRRRRKNLTIVGTIQLLHQIDDVMSFSKMFNMRLHNA